MARYLMIIEYDMKVTHFLAISSDEAIRYRLRREIAIYAAFLTYVVFGFKFNQIVRILQRNVVFFTKTWLILKSYIHKIILFCHERT